MKKVLAVAAVVAMFGGGFFAFVRPMPPIPLLDANQTVLAESDLQGYCGGLTYMTNRGKADARQAANCRADESVVASHSNDRDLRVVLPAFCQGIVDGAWDGTVRECVSIATSYRIWPTIDGGLTDAWDDNYPYPLDGFGRQEGQTNDDSRTGDRGGNAR